MAPNGFAGISVCVYVCVHARVRRVSTIELQTAGELSMAQRSIDGGACLWKYVVPCSGNVCSVCLNSLPTLIQV